VKIRNKSLESTGLPLAEDTGITQLPLASDGDSTFDYTINLCLILKKNEKVLIKTEKICINVESQAF
jgi:hypothetical protein